VLIANEQVEEMRRRKKSCVIAKVDFEKVYDFNKMRTSRIYDD